jgi:quercetin dioxygenase-like cupin family protein
MKKSIQQLAIGIIVVIALVIPSKALAQDATKVDPKHYSVEFENDEIRVLRIKYGSGETSVMHNHARGYTFFVTNYEVTFEIPNGEVIKASGKAGTTMWADATQHLPTNIGKYPLEVIQVEFKTKSKKKKKKN